MATTAAQPRAAEPAPALDERFAALVKLVEKVPADQAQRTRWRAQLAAMSPLRMEPRARVAVIGEFSSGKSTFVNRFLADDHLLATATLPTTPVATEIVSAPWLALRMTVDGSTFEGASVAELAAEGLLDHLGLGAETAALSLTDLVHLVTGDGTFHSRVTQIRVLHPCRRLRRGLLLVDTPGVNSTEQDHVTRTTEYLAVHADAVIVVMAAGQGVPTSLADFLSLHVDPARLRNALFVVTRVDQVPADELGRVLSFIRRRLAKIVGIEVEPWVLPAGDADELLDELGRSMATRASAAREATLGRFFATVAADVVRRGDECAAELTRRRAALVERKLPAAAPRYRQAQRALVDLHERAADELREEGQRTLGRVRSETLTSLGTMLASSTSKQALRAAEPTLRAAIEAALETYRQELLNLANSRVAETDLASEKVVEEFTRPYQQLATTGTRRHASRPARLNPRTGVGAATHGSQTRKDADAVLTGTAAVLGSVVGTLVVPGLGTLVGGAFGGGLAALMRTSAADVRRGVMAGVEQSLDSNLTRVLEKVTASGVLLLAKHKTAALARLDVRSAEVAGVRGAFEAERAAESRSVSRELNHLTALLQQARAGLDDGRTDAS